MFEDYKVSRTERRVERTIVENVALVQNKEIQLFGLTVTRRDIK